MAENQPQEFQDQYPHIKRDVKRVIVTNILLIALLTAVYFADKKFGFLASLQKFF